MCGRESGSLVFLCDTLTSWPKDLISHKTGLDNKRKWTSFDFLCLWENLQHVQYRVEIYNNVSGPEAKPDNNKCPCNMACEGELGTACYKYNAGTGLVQSLLVCFLSSTTAADVSPGQRSHDPLLLSTTPSQRIKPWSGYPSSPAPVSSRETLHPAGCASCQLRHILTEGEPHCRIQTLPGVTMCGVWIEEREILIWCQSVSILVSNAPKTQAESLGCLSHVCPK